MPPPAGGRAQSVSAADRTIASGASSITATSWVATREIELAEWIAAGQYLGTVGRSSQWWIGDWILYGNTKFGERYARAARITGYDVQTLTNMVYVASRYEISRRREKLSWSHHESLAALTPAEQDHWLDQAAAERLSVADLRMLLRSARASSPEADAGEDPALSEAGDAALHAGPPVVVCPGCGDQIPIPDIFLRPPISAPEEQCAAA